MLENPKGVCIPNTSVVANVSNLCLFGIVVYLFVCLFRLRIYLDCRILIH